MKNGSKKNELILVAGNGNPEMAKRISDYLKIPLTPAGVSTFADDEIKIEIKENVRLSDAVVIQPTCRSFNPNTHRLNKENSVNDNILELILLIDALKRASARRVTAVIPYYGYGRQDRKVEPRVPIGAKAIAACLERAGAERIIAVELHANQIQGFFDDPVDNLYASPIMVNYINDFFPKNLVIVSPDAGGVKVTRAYAKKLNADWAIVDKDRTAPNKSKAGAVIGDVKGRVAIILDDMVDTAGTMADAARVLMEAGAAEVHAICAHLVLSHPGVERIMNSPIKTLVGTDTIPLRKEALNCPKIGVISIAPIVGEAIIRSFTGESVSTLFEVDYNDGLIWVKKYKNL